MSNETNLQEWVTTEKARLLFKSGRGIKAKSLREKVKDGKIPKDAVKISGRGNYFFHLPTLMGFVKCLFSCFS